MSFTITRAIQYPDFHLKACAGLVEGVEPFTKFGANLDIDIDTLPEDVHTLGGAKLFPDAASTISIVSTSANDTSTGTGIRTLTVEGLDANYLEVSEVITLNGLTPVVTTSSFLRVHRLYGSSAGSTGGAAGNITATHSEGDIAQITTGSGQSRIAAYTVPAGKTLLIDSYIVGLVKIPSSNSYASINFEIRLFGTGIWREQLIVTPMTSGSSVEQIVLTDRFYPLSAKTDVRIRVTNVSANNTAISATVGGYLIDNKVFKW